MKRIYQWTICGLCLLFLGSCNSYDTESQPLLKEYNTWNSALQGLETHFQRLDKVLQQQVSFTHDTIFKSLNPIDSAFHAQRNRIVSGVHDLRNTALHGLKVYRSDVVQLGGRFRDVAAPKESQASKSAMERRLNQLHEQSRTAVLQYEEELDRLKQKSQSSNSKGVSG